MIGLVWTPSTVSCAVIAVLAVAGGAPHRDSGLCDCHDHCGDSDSPRSGCGLSWLFGCRR